MASISDIAKILASKEIPTPTQRPDIFEQAKLEYPALRSVDFGHVMTPASDDGRMLEFWPPNEEGDSQYPRPYGLPIGEPGVQVISPDTTANDVAADIVSHYLVNEDPRLKTQYEQFARTFDTPEGQARLAKDYQWYQSHMGERRPLDQWAEQTRIPAYFRGYAFNQWPDETFSEMYSPHQRSILDEMVKYLRGGNQ